VTKKTSPIETNTHFDRQERLLLEGLEEAPQQVVDERDEVAVRLVPRKCLLGAEDSLEEVQS
jgi:hypothetical protein